MFVMT